MRNFWINKDTTNMKHSHKLPKRIKGRDLKRYLYIHVHSIIHNS